MYQTLYRKYRPSCFKEIIGQDAIVKILINSIKNNHISHAYMFNGPRGTGKTSTAKIFARAINCLNTKDGDICGNCEACNISSNSLDIIEIDAASNNGVDEIRNLKEKVTLVPSELKYKVYIIDEVHMLTLQAFNALLKTLEEPPEHVIFILATTDPQKVPATIISRCQCFNFCRISNNNIVKNLEMICKKESINVENSVLETIAVISDGGMRDSIGMLDKISSFSTDKITLENFLSLNGLVTDNDLTNFTNLIMNGSVNEVINLLEQWNDNGGNLLQIMIQYLNYLKNYIVTDYINSKSLNNNYLKLANIINENLFNAQKSSNPKIYLEVLIINFISKIDENIISQEIISKKVNNEIKSNNNIVVEKNVNSSNVSHETINNSNKIEENEVVKTEVSSNKINNDNKFQKSNIKDVIDVRVNNSFIDATKSLKNNYIELFKKLDDYSFNPNFGFLVCTLLDGKIRVGSPKYLVISYEYDSVVSENYKNIEKMENILKDLLKIDVKLAIISDNEWKNWQNFYITNFSNGSKPVEKEEPKLMFDTAEVKNDTNVELNSSNLDAFSDILEVN